MACPTNEQGVCTGIPPGKPTSTLRRFGKHIVSESLIGVIAANFTENRYASGTGSGFLLPLPRGPGSKPHPPGLPQETNSLRHSFSFHSQSHLSTADLQPVDDTHYLKRLTGDLFE